MLNHGQHSSSSSSSSSSYTARPFRPTWPSNCPITETARLHAHHQELSEPTACCLPSFLHSLQPRLLLCPFLLHTLFVTFSPLLPGSSGFPVFLSSLSCIYLLLYLFPTSSSFTLLVASFNKIFLPYPYYIFSLSCVLPFSITSAVSLVITSLFPVVLLLPVIATSTERLREMKEREEAERGTERTSVGEGEEEGRP